MNRRNAVLILAFCIGESMAFDRISVKKFLYKLQDRVLPKPKSGRIQKIIMENPPSLVSSTSVEAALNSRCTSDGDGDQRRFHWGKFDPKYTFSLDFVQNILSLLKTTQFTTSQLSIDVSESIFTFKVPADLSGIEQDWVMIESGMQQQLLCLLCAACGIGMVFISCGNDGAPGTGNEWLVTRIKIDPMLASYGDSFFTEMAPGKERAWVKGNLEDPVRKGKTPFTTIINTLTLKDTESRSARDADIGQLLWACRGRTPHYYKSEPWGMTIPVSHGQQSITKVYLIKELQISLYINWSDKHPTHSLSKIKTIENSPIDEMFGSASRYSALIVLTRNDTFKRAFWEAGSETLNMILQAVSLGISYETIFLNDNQRTYFKNLGLEDACVAFAV